MVSNVFCRIFFNCYLEIIYFLDSVQTGSGAHPASYPMATRSFFPAGKAAGAWNWPVTSI